MPEYLAPGVYVEETSFRSKSIEGVGTSTTAFVGPSRRGPVAGAPDLSELDIEKKVPTPEIITSFVDFERVFGGFDDIALGGQRTINYLAHAVNAFFSNGGGRLYVARVIGSGAASAETAQFAGGASFKARVPGAAANGQLVFSLAFSPLQDKTWASLPWGSVVRLGGGQPAIPATITGAPRPYFSVQDGATLSVKINDGQPVEKKFQGKRAEVTGVAADNITIGAATPFEIVVDGQPQRFNLDAPAAGGNARPLIEVAAELNRKLRGVSVTLEDHTLTIATDRAGTGASLKVVQAPSELHLSTLEVKHDWDAANNNVADLANLSVEDLRRVFGDEVAPTAANKKPTMTISEVVKDGQRQFVFATTRTGADPLAALTIIGGSAADALGLEAGRTETPAKGNALGSFSVKVKATPAANEHEAIPQDPDGVFAVSLTITTIDADGHVRQYDDLGLDHRHPRFVGKVLPLAPTRKTEALENLYYLHGGDAVHGATWAQELVAGPEFQSLQGVTDTPERIERKLGFSTAGIDGMLPTAAEYKKAFAVLDRLDDISIVAAPGYAAMPKGQADAIEGELLIHVEKRRSYRIGVLDARPGQSVGEVRETKARVDSKHAALYYPWVVIANPLWRPGDAAVPREINVPPSGFVTGIYARNDIERGVFKAPANEIVRGALRFETDINFAQQEVLNPLGVNCLRFFPGRGYRVWGGRTISSDPEWKYVNVRRYFNYLERSIDVGTQWAVFEPNGERLWANVRETIASFLLNEWRSGALLGGDAKEAFFVRCDRSTMDQNDLDNGRLVCLIGVAVVKPAEFVIFRVGQKTADARS